VLKYIHNRAATQQEFCPDPKIDKTASGGLDFNAMKALLLRLVLTVAMAQAGSSTLKVGDKAPDFSLPNGDGKVVTLSEYLGRGPLVLVFYRGFW
jgi:hypothetical protein